MPKGKNSLCIAIIGGGISGIAAARLLHGHAKVVVFERSDKIGGLIRCDLLSQGLYHKLGGHVFNTKSPQVKAWFWQHFDAEHEFYQIERDAKILLDSSLIGYPIENHIYQLAAPVMASVIDELLARASRADSPPPANFKEFLSHTFGSTLCRKYFYPYNEKIWRTDLSAIPLGWLKGKLPMPNIADILRANIRREPERNMVHSRFFYPRRGGSQFVIDRLAEGSTVRLGQNVRTLTRNSEGRWLINGRTDEGFDAIIYTGDIRNLSAVCPVLSSHPASNRVKALKTRGITNVFCECDHTTLSWLYLPEPTFAANRIIYTGGFSPANNLTSRMTCVVEFVFGESADAIDRDLRTLPGNLTKIATNHVQDAYVIQDHDTRDQIASLKEYGNKHGVFFTGRFAEWEYYNMDKAIEAAGAMVSSMGYPGLGVTT